MSMVINHTKRMEPPRNDGVWVGWNERQTNTESEVF